MSARRKAALPWLAFAFCCLVWGSTFLFIRIGNDSLPPVWGATLRLTIASVLLTAIALAVRAPWPRGAPLTAALWFGAVDFGVSLPLLYWGEQTVPSGLAAIMYATLPLSTSLFARGFGLEPLRRGTIAAAALAILGVSVLFSTQLGGHYSRFALAAVFLGAATAALSGVLLKRSPGAHPLWTNAVAHGVGAVMCALISTALGESHALPVGREWIPVLYLTIVGSIGAFVVFAWLLQRWSASRLSFIAVITPVVAVLLGVLVRGEQLSAANLSGAGVILIAAALGITSSRARSPKP